MNISRKLGMILLAATLVLGLNVSDLNAAEVPAEVQDIVKRGTLRVGVKSDVPGFGIQALSGEYEGMEIDLARKIAEAMGLSPDKVTFTAVGSGSASSC